MRYWKIQIKLEADEDLTEDDVISAIETNNHPGIDYIAVDSLMQYRQNDFITGFQTIYKNFCWWKSHLYPEPGLLYSSTMFWSFLTSN